ncbi:MAG: NotI family restriction endonuclease [Dehalococcoidia bacterium]|nr:NotI family restriction endonuclease [Dehalococcoidia bacterium]
MPTHPLAEVFGFPTDNLSREAARYRRSKLCPFNNKVPNCTKDKANDPLGVCSIYDDDEVVITCPIRFRQEWIIAEDAATFLFPAGATWTSLTEVRLKDKYGKTAGNIDIVLVAYNDQGRVVDFGALEIQGVYITGNVRRPFQHYMEDPARRSNMDWTQQTNYPRPDYLSSSRKRLAPQLIYKGGILNAWNKKIAVALNRGFYDTLPVLEETDEAGADIAWLIYDLRRDGRQNRYLLHHHKTVYTQFEASLNLITRSEPGEQQDFIDQLQNKLDDKLEGENPPDAPTIDILL